MSNGVAKFREAGPWARQHSGTYRFYRGSSIVVYGRPRAPATAGIARRPARRDRPTPPASSDQKRDATPGERNDTVFQRCHQIPLVVHGQGIQFHSRISSFRTSPLTPRTPLCQPEINRVRLLLIRAPIVHTRVPGTECTDRRRDVTQRRFWRATVAFR